MTLRIDQKPILAGALIRGDPEPRAGAAALDADVVVLGLLSEPLDAKRDSFLTFQRLQIDDLVPSNLGELRIGCDAWPGSGTETRW